jgi:putative phage-type endonuclease
MLEEQRSDDWFAARAGKVTASALHKVMARTKTGFGADRANYHAQLVAERLTGRPADSYSNAAMQWGIDTEAAARDAYSALIGDAVAEIGFVDHPAVELTGASPDGLVGFDGLVEIKCPNTSTHLAALTGAGIDKKYMLQMQWQMACTERQWCDFASFDPRMPPEMQLHVRRVDRDDALLAEIEAELIPFLAEVAATVEHLTIEYRKAA